MTLLLILALLRVVPVADGDVHPHGPAVVYSEAPVYPAAALKARMEGSAVVSVTITGAGDVSNASSEGTNPLLAAAARHAAEKWRFSRSDDSEDRCAALAFRFTLTGGEFEEGNPEVSLLSPYSLVVAMPPQPSPATTIVDPAPQPCFMFFEPGSMTICERALRLLPIR